MNSDAFDQTQILTPYQKYRRRDAIRLLEWEAQMVDQNIGGYARDETQKRMVIFVTLENGETFKST